MNKEVITTEARHSLKKWKSRVGFARWRIGVRTKAFHRADGYPQDGDFTANYHAQRATIFLGTEPRHSIEEIVIHELVHIILLPLDQKTISAIRFLPKSKQRREGDSFFGALETVVDQITKGLLNS